MVSEVTAEDIERLASRVAMLVSDDGEADNAGRAVGQLARRLGLSGGDLKQLMLAGAGAGSVPGGGGVQARLGPGGVARLEQEVAALRRELRQAEEAARVARQDRETLIAENGAMRVAIYRHRANARLRRMMAGLVVMFLGVAAVALLWFGPSFHDAPPARLEPAPVLAPLRAEVPGSRVALVRAPGAVVYRDADRGSEALGRLAGGTRLLVLGTEWRSMMQWARVEVGGQLGYVATTEIDLF